MMIKVYDEGNEPVCDVKFMDNLTQQNVPDYVNMNCKIGLTEYPGERYQGWYVLMYYDIKCPDRSYGEVVSPTEAYDYCAKRNRYDIIEEFDIKFEREREVI